MKLSEWLIILAVVIGLALLLFFLTGRQERYFELTIHVRDALSGNPLEARICVLQDCRQGSTYNVRLPQGSYRYTVSKEGYQTEEGIIRLISDMTWLVDLQKQSARYSRLTRLSR